MITIAPLDGFKGGGEGKYYAEVTLLSHPHIEASIMRVIADTMIEWRRQLLGGSCQPLDSNSVAARNLITIFDFFLSHGFNKGNRLYWQFVKEFMSRNETNYLKREWRVISTQQLSVAWLKDVLNKQTLLYYFQKYYLLKSLGLTSVSSDAFLDIETVFAPRKRMKMAVEFHKTVLFCEIWLDFGDSD
ncbi:unnamed protein product [Onchocerca flexuosa]|uniref:RUN domain-containing protein n=1 Tax=Onchocerca flexuosa TaxID=387005 RepID=A0A183H9I4_9BILA|nr:unnamed protein product [Onchocerca flexuosa]